MPLILGGPAGLTFTGGDGPNELPIKATIDGQMVTLSDGSRYFQDLGVTPDALTWTGTFELNDNYGTPQQKAAFVEALRDSRQRTTLSLDERSWGGFVQDATLTPIAAWRVKYSITFEVEVPGTLTSVAEKSHQDHAGEALDALNALTAGLSAATQSANSAVQTARIAAGY